MKDFRKIIIWGILTAIPSGLLLVALPLYLRELNISYTNIGLIFGIGPIVGLIINYFVGSHSDVVGRKPYISFSSFLDVCYCLFLTVATEIWHFISLGFLSNISQSINNISSFSYLSDILPKKRRGELMGKYDGIVGIFLCFGIFGAGYLILLLGFKNLFFFCGLIAAISLFASFTFKERIKTKKQNIKEHLNSLNPKGISNHLKFLFLVGTLYITIFQVITAFGLPLYFKSLGASVEIVGILIGTIFICFSITQLVAGKIADIKNPKIIFSFFILLAIPFNYFLIFAQNYIIAVILFAAQGLLMGIMAPAFMKIQLDTLGNQRGRDLAFLTNSNYLGIIFGSILCGLIIDYLGFPFIFVFRIFGFLLVALLMLLSLKIFGK